LDKDTEPITGFAHHREITVQVAAQPQTVFAHLDDQTRLAEHMGKPSLMMGGGKMAYDFDELKGQAVGSHIRMGGSAFGLQLFVDEVVTERMPPHRKVWRTVGRPKLFAIGAYEMGFELNAAQQGSALRIWIDYELPPSGLGRLLPCLGDAYARWCVKQMAGDAERTFSLLANSAGDPAERSGCLRYFYRDWRPTFVGKTWSQLVAWASGGGLTPEFLVALQVKDRLSGRLEANVLVAVDYQAQQYLVSMLGGTSDWVLNARANGGKAFIKRGQLHPVVLTEIETSERAQILKA
jgi:hypothetical protein